MAQESLHLLKHTKLLGSASNDGLDVSSAPSISYMAMRVNQEGLSTGELCELEGFSLASLGGKASPIWMKQFAGSPTSVWFTVLPIGWVGDWHESPAAQWVCAISGRWWIETADGKRIEMGPGEIHWGQDQGTKAHRGHRSGQCGPEPCVQLMVRYANAPLGSERCIADDVPSYSVL